MSALRVDLELRLAVVGAVLLLLVGTTNVVAVAGIDGYGGQPSVGVKPVKPLSLAAPGGRVVAWGWNDNGQATVPAGLSGVVAVAGGEAHSLALKANGTIVAWGWDYYGQTTVPAGLHGVTAIAAGEFDSLALKSDGTVVAWGDDNEGETVVPAGLAGVVAIAAGYYHNLALKSDGTVVGWGWDEDGETDTPAGLSGVVAIAAGDDYSLALKADGTVVAWGALNTGVTAVPAGLSGVVAIAMGERHSLALKADGTVVAWGGNFNGESNVPAGLTGVTAVSAGIDDSFALKADGTLVSWGFDDFGQTEVPAGLRNVLAIGAGHEHTLAIVSAPAGPATAFNVRTTNPYVAGAAHSVTVSALDSAGNVATSYRGTVHFTSSDSKASVPVDYTFTAADAGVHVFSYALHPSLMLKTAGSQSVRATDTHTSAISGAQTVVVNAGPAKTLVVRTTNPYVAGAAHSVTVTAQDAYGNVATGYRGTIHFTSSDAKASLPANFTFTATDAGVHRFSYALRPPLILETIGTQWVRATDLHVSAITGAQSVVVH
jgi:hypothetical protein